MLARFLVNVRRPIDSEPLDPRGQRYRPRHAPAGAPNRIHDFADRLVEQPVVVRFKAYADLIVHPLSQIPVSRTCRHSQRAHPASRCRSPCVRSLRTPYFRTFETTPTPTGSPPTRTADPRPSSIGTGVIGSRVILMLTRCSTTSVPSGRLSPPVTSVVRK